MSKNNSNSVCDGCCEKCNATSNPVSPIADFISVETRIDQVYNQFMEVAHNELLPDLLLLGGEDMFEDIYQETAVIVMELLSRLPVGTVPSQSDIYCDADAYLREWIRTQVTQRANSFGFSYSELIKLAGLEDPEDFDDGWVKNTRPNSFGTIHTIHFGSDGSIFLKF